MGESKSEALILVDFQDEFVKNTGFFKRPVALEPLLEPLAILLDAARQAGVPVVWVESRYEEGVSLGEGHLTRPCCAPGSASAQPPEEILALRDAQDVVWHKSRHAALGDSGLEAWLRERHITAVSVCGVAAEFGVRATVEEAVARGFKVRVVSDCSASGRASTARDTMARLGKIAEVVPHVALLSRWKSVRGGLGAGDTAVHYGLLPEGEAIFSQVAEEVEWEQMRHRGGVVPRLVALQGELEQDGTMPLYRHPADEHPTMRPWTPQVEALRDQCAALLSQSLNHALIQRYEDGMGYISPHCDKTLDIARGTAIVGLSLGATRTIILKSKAPDARGEHLVQHLELPHGSLFVLGWESNQKFQHGIRQDRRPEHEKRDDERRDGGERISLTMRSVATFITPEGELFGQGARRKRREDPAVESTESEREQAERLLTAFGQENQSDHFDWDHHYGPGFDVLDFQSLRDPEGEG